MSAARTLESETKEEPKQAAVAKETPPKVEEPPKKKPVRLVVGSIVGVVALGIAGWYVVHRGLEDTDDAQVEAEVVAVPSRIGGVVAEVHFTDNQTVKAGDLLVVIDPAPFAAKLAQADGDLASAKATADAADAEAQVVEATASGQHKAAKAALQGASVSGSTVGDDIANAQASVSAAQTARNQASLDLERYKKLLETGSISKAQVDQAQTAFDGAEASLSQAKARLALANSETGQASARIAEAQARLGQTSAYEAQVAQARARAANAHARVEVAKAARDLASLDLGYTKIVAARDGTLSKKSIAVGQMINAGQPLAMLVTNEAPFVVANFKETQLSKMKPGQKATIEVDAFSGVELHGHVESMSGATGARFSLLPPDNATGNYTKVVQRVPVRIALDSSSNVQLRPGMSAVVTVDTR